ncbi:PREDICTED: uncharacterized protein LOC108567756 [Nicrophorus vespilloides]|uniref:Uncharacterized protein LOC108567756 n=1 Tax=Nicrophorus vespilloides TaxID=110193 RepID=A0ABM1NAP0_NICVS|nr:PREDICTED: uncharacterized protein LOC108567756 [Nicrophorus vespilloides]
MEFEDNDFFATNIKIIKLSGVWVGSERDHPFLRGLYKLYNIVIVIYFVFLFTPFEFMVLNETVSSLPDLMKNLNMGMTHALATIKVYIWFSKRTTILNICNTLSRNTKAEKIGDFDPEKITREDKVVKQMATLGFFSVACCVGSSSMLSSFYTLMFHSEDEYIYVTDENNVTTYIYDQQLPYSSYIPWDHKKNIFNFSCATAFQCIAVLYSAFIIVGQL